MKLLYISCHAILEYDEVKLFHELGIDVFSAGAYANPAGHPSLPRPGIEGLTHYEDLERAASTLRATGGVIAQELIDWCDAIMFMHEPAILEKNWSRIKHKRIIFRSIGQCVPAQERVLQTLKNEGLQIVRYSPAEARLPDFAGQDAVIRFYKDPDEYKDYNGNTSQLITMCQSIQQRDKFVMYSEIQELFTGYPHKYYGISNEGLGDKWGGPLDYEAQKQVLRDNRVFIYGGTWPAPYTLSFIEAWMTGIPIVALGFQTVTNRLEVLPYYEVNDLITDAVDGFCSDNIAALRVAIDILLKEPEIAKQTGLHGRFKAIELFGKETISLKWKEFLYV